MKKGMIKLVSKHYPTCLLLLKQYIIIIKKINMKKIILLQCTLFSFFFNSFSQAQQSMGAIRQKISVKQYAGKTILLKGASKMKPLENSAGSVLFFKTQKQNGKEGQTIFCKKKLYISGWQTDEISGTLEADVDSLSFGFLFTGKAVCKFDEFELQIDGKVLTLADKSFENNKVFPNQNWTAPILSKNYKVSFSNTSPNYGKQSLLVDGSDGMAYTDFGANDTIGKFENINGIKIYYEIYGTGDPLLLLHGNHQSIKDFDQQIVEFSKYYKVIVVDTRGHGQSTTDTKTYSYDLFAEDINLLLEALKIENINIVGWSDGGNTGLILAMKHPEKIKKLVTMGANIFIDKTVIDNGVFKEINKRITAQKADTSFESKNSVAIYTMLLNEPKYTFPDLNKITCPVLVMAGEKDVIKEAHTKGIASNIKNSTLNILKKATHELPQENPKLFNEIVLEFLKK
jgi:pimeloyl-ACP methyl ester carboxylesterase